MNEASPECEFGSEQNDGIESRVDLEASMGS